MGKVVRTVVSFLHKEAPNSTTFVIWNTNFKSDVCSSSGFPTEAMVWIDDVDSSRNMDESKSSYSIQGRMIPDS